MKTKTKGKTKGQAKALPVVHSTAEPQALTERELQICQLITNGLSNQEVAFHLDISVKTVEAHRANIYKKFRVSNTARLIRELLVRKLVSMPGVVAA